METVVNSQHCVFDIGTMEGSIFLNIERSIHITDTQNKGCQEGVFHRLLSKTGDSYTLYISGVDTTRIVTYPIQCFCT